jgi:predicted lipoprotein with Yx(FWY)xxD motif
MRASLGLSFVVLLALRASATSVDAFVEDLARRVPVPPGFGIRLTIEGPVFVNERGMTLYTIRETCSDAHQVSIRAVTATEGAVDFPVNVDRARSCLEKYPPVLANDHAAPVGKWTIALRQDGARQWRYDGKPLHTSIKDQRPDELNASYPTRLGRPYAVNLARAPLAGMPAGVTVRETPAGLALANFDGRIFYFADPSRANACDARCKELWRPFVAPAMASTERLGRQWTLVNGANGVAQWAFDGKPLFTYERDAPAHGEQVFADTFGGQWSAPIDGWHVALLLSAPLPPAGVSTQRLPGDNQLFSFGLPKIVYADDRGMTLYTLHCSEGDEEGGLDCDDAGDNPTYWSSFCGGIDRCADTWRPLPAPDDVERDDGIWSVAVIDPRQPWSTTDGARGMRVWAYRGRPVFTYVGDTLPGDFYGDDHGFGTTGSGMQARPIPAMGFAEARPPVVMIAGSR